ncbi:hypothetical protein FRC09_007341 [Ceratobasidium sp. 395]|nr:hypothetical protein FRC09_007341 [Ceratobasidium sp. 395]
MFFVSSFSLRVTTGQGASKSRLSSVPPTSGAAPRMIVSASGPANPDPPRITAITAQVRTDLSVCVSLSHASTKSEAGVHWTLQSSTRFMNTAPLSSSKTTYEPAAEQVINVAGPSLFRPKRSITVQRLGLQTPSPPKAIQYMAARGGGRFSLVDLLEFHHPVSERFATQHVEHAGNVVGEYQTSASREEPIIQVAPQQSRILKRLVTEHTHPRCLKSMDPLKLAVHNNLVCVMNLKATPSPPRTRVHSFPRKHLPKPEGSRHKHRSRPAVAPLDMDAVRAYNSTNPLADSPPESPGPITPASDSTGTMESSMIVHVVDDMKAEQKGSAYQTLSGGSEVRRTIRRS